MGDSRIALVVEDDPIARLVVVKTLANLPNTAVIGVATVAEAKHVAASEQIAVAVLDLQLPDGNGLEVLEVLRSQQPPACVVLASAFIQKFCSQAQIEENVTLMEKPVDPRELQAVIEQHTDPTRSELNPFSVPEYLQIACMGVHSVVLEVVRQNESIGTICIRNGDIWTAADARGTGEPAFRRLLEQQQVEVRCRPPHSDSQDRQINRNWQQLLLDAARVTDENNHHNNGFCEDEWDFFSDEPDPIIEEIEKDQPAVPAVQPVPVLSFEQCMENAARLVIVSQLDEALELYTEALRLRPESRLASSNAARLRRLGFGA